MKTAGFIGGGRITRILLNGFSNAMVSFDEINVFETSEPVLSALKAEFPKIKTSGTDFSRVASADWVFLALHPPVLVEALKSMRDSINPNALIVSLAPKITIEKLQLTVPRVSNIGRMNPNAGTYVNKGFNPVCFSREADREAIKEFIEVFEKLGKVPLVSENQLEAYAVISAMGHTYFWYQLQQLRELGISYGLSETEVSEAISSMLCGTAETLFNSGLPYDKVIDLVPVKPMAEHEDSIREFYRTCLNGIYQKIKPV